MATDAERQKRKRERRLARLACNNGDAYLLVDAERVRVSRFLPPLDAGGFPTIGHYGAEDQPITFQVADVEFVGAREGLAAHGPRGPHGRCRICRDDQLRAQRAADKVGRKPKRKRKRRARRQMELSW